ncbi:MAG TPA: hypothetical protein VGR05_00835 [Sphingomicrobium sp.]|nr:hypothetical protein [Sphingomicrobium sp.]
MLLAPHQIVEPQPEHPRDQLQFARLAPVARFTQIGGDWLGALARCLPLAVVSLAQRGREAFFSLAPGHRARPRLAVHDRRQHAPFAVQSLEGKYLLIDPA